MRTWIVLPAFNEADNLSPVMTEIARTMEASGMPFEILVVDDGSSDATPAIAKSYEDRLPVRVLAHSQNMGLGRAIDTGLRAAVRFGSENDVIVTMDADNSHPSDLIPHMVNAIQGGADIAIASRYVKGGVEEGVPVLRRVLSRGVGLLMHLRFGLLGVRDYSSGYRAYGWRVLHSAIDRYGARFVETTGFTVMAELLVKLQAFHPRMVELPLRLRYDLKRGGSKMRVFRTITGYAGLLLSRSP